MGLYVRVPELANDAAGACLKVAFVVGAFPVIPETYIVDQVAQLSARGVRVDIFAFRRGDLGSSAIADVFHRTEMIKRVRYLDPPDNLLLRGVRAIPLFLRLAVRHPRLVVRALNVFTFGRKALSLRLLFWAAPFTRTRYDVVHCHFGTVANNFLRIDDVARIGAPIVTSFYGFDASLILATQPPDYYDRLKRESSLFLVMSENMKDRLVHYGFAREKIRVHPVSVDVPAYPFDKRVVDVGEQLKIVSVGRFVEKKGFDDLLRALAIINKLRPRSFACYIVGGGPMETHLRDLTRKLGLDAVVNFCGYKKVDFIIDMFMEMHVFVQPSKTAHDGDME